MAAIVSGHSLGVESRPEHEGYEREMFLAIVFVYVSITNEN